MISGFELGVNEVCTLLGLYAALIGSFLPTFLDKSWCLWNSRSGVSEDLSSGTFPSVIWSFYLCLQGQQSKMKALLSTETSVTLHQLTWHNLHQHLCENVMSHRIEDRAWLSYSVWRIFYGSVKIIATFTKAPYWIYFYSVHYYILKLWLTPISAQFYSQCILSLICSS